MAPPEDGVGEDACPGQLKGGCQSPGRHILAQVASRVSNGPARFSESTFFLAVAHSRFVARVPPATRSHCHCGCHATGRPRRIRQPNQVSRAGPRSIDAGSLLCGVAPTTPRPPAGARCPTRANCQVFTSRALRRHQPWDGMALRGSAPSFPLYRPWTPTATMVRKPRPRSSPCTHFPLAPQPRPCFDVFSHCSVP